jgi:hypothetical protein
MKGEEDGPHNPVAEGYHHYTRKSGNPESQPPFYQRPESRIPGEHPEGVQGWDTSVIRYNHESQAGRVTCA